MRTPGVPHYLLTAQPRGLVKYITQALAQVLRSLAAKK